MDDFRRTVEAFVAGRLDAFTLSDGGGYRRIRRADGDLCERRWSDGATHAAPFTPELGAHLLALAQAESEDELNREMQRYTGFNWKEIQNPPKGA